MNSVLVEDERYPFKEPKTDRRIVLQEFFFPEKNHLKG
jgi:hypothetical protein